MVTSDAVVCWLAIGVIWHNHVLSLAAIYLVGRAAILAQEEGIEPLAITRAIKRAWVYASDTFAITFGRSEGE